MKKQATLLKLLPSWLSDLGMLSVEKHQKDLTALIRACRKGQKAGQKELYKQYYGYAMSICLRYAHSSEEAEEILNDGFLKVFQKIENHRDEASFKSWLRRIMVNSAIDHYRRYQKHYHQLDITHASGFEVDASALSQLSKQEIMKMVQTLSPAYRMVFNLYAIEGLKHPEIAKKLDISVGTSKSNLAKARMKLKKMLNWSEGNQQERYG